MKSVVTAVTMVGSAAAMTAFPSCLNHNGILRGKGGNDHEFALFTDVSMYGLSGCFLDNCQNSDKWISVSYASCADACSKTPECRHWTYGLEDGSQKCWLRVSDEGKEDLSGYVNGGVDCYPADYPNCIKGDTLYGGGPDNAFAFFGDVTSVGKYEGCANDDCHNTDKFASPSPVDCSTTCANVDGCNFWTYGYEQEISKCFMRSSENGVTSFGGFTSGSVDCAPLSAWEAISNKVTSPQVGKAVEPGNTECWGGGFDWSVCCHASHGPLGNAHCWDGDSFTYQGCCIAPEKQEL